MPSRFTALLALTCSGMLIGCGSWRRSMGALDATLAPREGVQIWSRGRALAVHGVQVRGDSVRAVPRWYSPTCDSCAVYVARTDIDSVRIRVAAPGRTALLATFLAVITAWGIVLVGSGRWFS